MDTLIILINLNTNGNGHVKEEMKVTLMNYN